MKPSNDNRKPQWYHYVSWGCVGALVFVAAFWTSVGYVAWAIFWSK